MIPNSHNGLGDIPLNQMIENAFFATHPYPIMFFKTDDYYNGVAKKLLPALSVMRQHLHMPSQVIMRMALSIAAYLEDQCSHLGLWSAFIHRHRELYGRWLPWYNTTSDDADYYEDEVNLQDVKFILWMILVSIEGTPVIDPEHEAIRRSAEGIFEILKDEYEVAPANKELVDYVYGDFMTEDFYNLKNILRWMTSTCYLMCVPSWEMEQAALIRNAVSSVVGDPGDPGIIPYLESSYECVHFRFGPLALYPKQWYVMMRQQRGLTKDNKEILDIESTPFYPFIVVSKDRDTITLRSCRDKEYVVDVDSFNDDSGKKLEEGDMFITSLVRYKGHWLSNGLTSLLQEKDTVKEGLATIKHMGDTLKLNNLPIDLFNMPDLSALPKVNEVIVGRLDEAIKENNGDRIFYFSEANAALDWQNRLAGREIGNKELFTDSFGEGPVMIYVTSDYRTVTLSHVATIKDPSNPYYDQALAYRGIDWIYTKFGVEDEFVTYLVEHGYLANLSFNPKKPDEKSSKLIGDNLPFFATFMRQYPC